MTNAASTITADHNELFNGTGVHTEFVEQIQDHAGVEVAAARAHRQAVHRPVKPMVLATLLLARSAHILAPFSPNS